MPVTKTRELSIRELINSAWRNYPHYVTTFSTCPCGRQGRRGSELCLECLADKLVATGKVTVDEVHAFFGLIRGVVETESALCKKVGEFTKL